MGLRLERPMRPASQVRVSTALTLALMTAVILALVTILTQALSTLRGEPETYPGYTLIAPLHSTKTYLMDMQGKVVHTWASAFTAGEIAYLLEDGHLLRTAQVSSAEQLFAAGGGGGRVQEFTWDGELVWDFKLHNPKQLSHHDLARLPNGNVLLIVWELETPDESLAAGRRPEAVDGPWLADSVIEIRPAGKTTGEVVWEWHAWDHLIQDHDSSRANFGDVAAHPELIDVNFGKDHFPASTRGARLPEEQTQEKKNRTLLRSLGYLGSPAARGNQGIIPDWTHVNAVAYNPELDQIMLTARSFNEFWIIDHSTTSAEAKGRAGGRGGKGGDLLYRWGNPRAYRAGTGADQRLFAPHDAHWIPPGRPGAGHVLVFNNGVDRPSGNYSSVDELVLPVDARGRYAREPGTAYGPKGPVWSYTAPKKSDFSAVLLSGAQRLPNGNTLICDSVKGRIFEVTGNYEVAWNYRYRFLVRPALGRLVRHPGSGPRRPGASPGRDPVFRAYRYGVHDPRLAGKDLKPGKTVDELESEEIEERGTR